MSLSPDQASSRHALVHAERGEDGGEGEEQRKEKRGFGVGRGIGSLVEEVVKCKTLPRVLVQLSRKLGGDSGQEGVRQEGS